VSTATLTRPARLQLDAATGPHAAALRLARVPDFALGEIMRASQQAGALDLALGVPELPVPAGVREAAADAILHGDNQYGNTWGLKPLREAIAAKVAACQGVSADPETEVTVTLGSTEGFLSALSSVVGAGDEVVLFEPLYESHLSAVLYLGATPRFVRTHAPGWGFDPAELAAAFGPRTRAVIVNTPTNPTGKVFTRGELELVGELCEKWDAVCVSDEIYEHMVFDGREHVSPIAIDSLRQRTLSVSGLSKTFRVSGWRIGYAIAAPKLTRGLRKVHDLTTAGVASPLQVAAASLLGFGNDYYDDLARDHQARRERLVAMLEPLGFDCHPAQGSCFMMADVSAFGFADANAFVHHLIRGCRVAMTPGHVFYSQPADGRSLVRVCFGKTDATLDEAALRLRGLEREI
jgi:aspartate/methionine/tyrosine aminotransferase